MCVFCIHVHVCTICMLVPAETKGKFSIPCNPYIVMSTGNQTLSSGKTANNLNC